MKYVFRVFRSDDYNLYSTSHINTPLSKTPLDINQQNRKLLYSIFSLQFASLLCLFGERKSLNVEYKVGELV